MFNPEQFITGTEFTVKGDASTWIVDFVSGDKIMATNKANGYRGPIPIFKVDQILNIARAEIQSEDIQIFDKAPEKFEEAPSFKKTRRKKRSKKWDS